MGGITKEPHYCPQMRFHNEYHCPLRRKVIPPKTPSKRCLMAEFKETIGKLLSQNPEDRSYYTSIPEYFNEILYSAKNLEWEFRNHNEMYPMNFNRPFIHSSKRCSKYSLDDMVYLHLTLKLVLEFTMDLKEDLMLRNSYAYEEGHQSFFKTKMILNELETKLYDLLRHVENFRREFSLEQYNTNNIINLNNTQKEHECNAYANVFCIKNNSYFEKCSCKRKQNKRSYKNFNLNSGFKNATRLKLNYNAHFLPQYYSKNDLLHANKNQEENHAQHKFANKSTENANKSNNKLSMSNVNSLNKLYNATNAKDSANINEYRLTGNTSTKEKGLVNNKENDRNHFRISKIKRTRAGKDNVKICHLNSNKCNIQNKKQCCKHYVGYSEENCARDIYPIKVNYKNSNFSLLSFYGHEKMENSQYITKGCKEPPYLSSGILEDLRYVEERQSSINCSSRNKENLFIENGHRLVGGANESEFSINKSAERQRIPRIRASRRKHSGKERRYSERRTSRLNVSSSGPKKIKTNSFKRPKRTTRSYSKIRQNHLSVNSSRPKKPNISYSRRSERSYPRDRPSGFGINSSKPRYNRRRNTGKIMSNPSRRVVRRPRSEIIYRRESDVNCFQNNLSYFATNNNCYCYKCDSYCCSCYTSLEQPCCPTCYRSPCRCYSCYNYPRFHHIPYPMCSNTCCTVLPPVQSEFCIEFERPRRKKITKRYISPRVTFCEEECPTQYFERQWVSEVCSESGCEEECVQGSRSYTTIYCRPPPPAREKSQYFKFYRESSEIDIEYISERSNPSTPDETHSRGTVTDSVGTSDARTSTLDVIQAVKAVATNTPTVSTKEIEIDPIPRRRSPTSPPIETKSKETNTVNVKRRTVGTDAKPIPEKGMVTMVNKATDPPYLRKMDRETNTVPEKTRPELKRRVVNVGTDPDPVKQRVESTTTNTPPMKGRTVVAINRGTQILPVYETKQTSWDPVDTRDDGTGPVEKGIVDKAEQYDYKPGVSQAKLVKEEMGHRQALRRQRLENLQTLTKHPKNDQHVMSLTKQPKNDQRTISLTKQPKHYQQIVSLTKEPKNYRQSLHRHQHSHQQKIRLTKQPENLQKIIIRELNEVQHIDKRPTQKLESLSNKPGYLQKRINLDKSHTQKLVPQPTEPIQTVSKPSMANLQVVSKHSMQSLQNVAIQPTVSLQTVEKNKTGNLQRIEKLRMEHLQTLRHPCSKWLQHVKDCIEGKQIITKPKMSHLQTATKQQPKYLQTSRKQHLNQRQTLKSIKPEYATKYSQQPNDQLQAIDIVPEDPCQDVIKEDPSDISLHLTINKIHEEIYRKRCKICGCTNICDCECCMGQEKLIVCENKNSNTIRITNDDCEPDSREGEEIIDDVDVDVTFNVVTPNPSQLSLPNNEMKNTETSKIVSETCSDISCPASYVSIRPRSEMN